MELPETGDVVTPIDDPCQFNPAWRSIVANYMFMSGVRSREDLESVSKTGGITVSQIVEVDAADEKTEEQKKPKKGKGAKAKKKTRRKTEVKKTQSPIAPFDTNPEYRVFASDEYIARYITMLEEDVTRSVQCDEGIPLRLATRWYSEIDHEAAMKKRLEALLLTEVGMDIITLDLTGQPSMQSVVEAYERLYFNCRDDSFNLNPSGQLVQRFAMPYGPLKTFLRKYEEVDDEGFVIGDGRPLAKESDVWRAIGALMGYEALIYYWRWERRAHGMKDASVKGMIDLCWKASMSRLIADLFTGNVSHEDASRLMSAFTAQSKFISDDRHEGGDGEDTTIALLAVLKAAAPKMRVLKEGSAGMITDNEIQGRIAAQQAIDKQGIQDAGKQVSDEVIDAQIVNAIEGE